MGTKLDKYADMEPNWDTPVIIESHINGERTKDMNPNTPKNYDEVIEDAIRCWDAGSCAIHVHNTDFNLSGEEAYEDYKKAWAEILEKRPNMTWYPTTTSFKELKEGEHGLDHTTEYLNEKLNVQIACVDPGINLFAQELDDEGHIRGTEYGFNYDQIAAQVDACNEKDISMIWGIYEPGFAKVALHYINQGMSTKGSFWDFYLIGDYGLTSIKPISTNGMHPTYESLYYYLNMIERANEELPWCISIWGEKDPEQRRKIIRRAIELGGHIKTGLETYYEPENNPTNLELLEEAQEIAREVGRPIATQQEAKEIYNID